MRKENKWTKGPMRLIFPALPIELRGVSGCRLLTASFDSAVGDEVYLAILEAPEFCQRLAETRPFQVFCKSGVARTSHGLVLFLLFTVRDGTDEVASYELFLNPQAMRTYELLSGWGQQTHFKVVLLDNEAGQKRGWFEFDNNYGIDKTVALIAQCIGHEVKGDFALAQQEFRRNYSLDDLKRM